MPLPPRNVHVNPSKTNVIFFRNHTRKEQVRSKCETLTQSSSKRQCYGGARLRRSPRHHDPPSRKRSGVGHQHEAPVHKPSTVSQPSMLRRNSSPPFVRLPAIVCRIRRDSANPLTDMARADPRAYPSSPCAGNCLGRGNRSKWTRLTRLTRLTACDLIDRIDGGFRAGILLPSHWAAATPRIYLSRLRIDVCQSSR